MQIRPGGNIWRLGEVKAPSDADRTSISHSAQDFIFKDSHDDYDQSSEVHADLSSSDATIPSEIYQTKAVLDTGTH